jgi:hypothetical protein
VAEDGDGADALALADAIVVGADARVAEINV